MEFEGYEKNWQLRPSRFRLDEEGHYWEPRDMGRGIMWVAAPPFAGYINFYLFEGPDIIIERHMKPLCDVPELKLGATPRDDGNLILSDDEKNELLRTDPLAEKFIRPYMMGKEFLYNTPRWCLWLIGAEPADIRKCPHLLERIEGVRQFRLKSTRAATRKQAETPMLFSEIRYSTTNYLAIPQVSSEKRKYIPIGWLSSDVVAGNNLYICENATLYQFGMLSSSVHNAWVRTFSGRLTSRIRYSNTLDYNAFPWPVLEEAPSMPNPERLAIEKTAQAILDARALYPRSSLADLYDERTMPPELRKAHNANDEAVMAAYGFKRIYADDRMHDEDIASALMYRYQDLTGCRERIDHYPNLDFWREYWGYDDEEDD